MLWFCSCLNTEQPQRQVRTQICWDHRLDPFPSVFFSSPSLFRTEPSSTGRASTIRHWSTTLLWLTVDTRSITATLGDAGRGTACRLAWADRNLSSPFPPSPLRLHAVALRSSWRRMDRQTRGPETSSFYSEGSSTWNSSPQLCIFLLSVPSLPFFFSFFLHDFNSIFFQYCVFLLCVQVGLLFWNLALTVLLSSLDLISTLAAKLPTVSFLQLIHLKTNVFFSILCNNVIFLFETKVRAYLISCVCICKGIFILLFYFCRVLNFVYETFPQAASLKCACVCASLHQVEMDPGWNDPSPLFFSPL